MKELSIEQLEIVNGGGIRKTLACLSQVAGGLGTLFTVASIGIFAMSPAGWIALGFGVVSLASGAAMDPYACD